MSAIPAMRITGGELGTAVVASHTFAQIGNANLESSAARRTLLNEVRDTSHGSRLLGKKKKRVCLERMLAGLLLPESKIIWPVSDFNP